MKTKITMLGMLLLATACHDDQTTFPEEPTEAAIVIEGQNAVEFRSALLAIADVDIIADGQEVPTTIDKALADLAKPGEQLSMRTALPANAREIEVRIQFDQFGGFDAGRYAGHIDARGTMLRFVAPASEVIENGKAVITLDLARSLAGVNPERLQLLPHYTLHY